MLSLLEYEFRSRWSSYLILFLCCLIWDALLMAGYLNIDTLSLVLFQITSLFFLFLLFLYSFFKFNSDFHLRNFLFIFILPYSTAKILTSKLILSLIEFTLLFVTHLCFILISIQSITNRVNIHSSLLIRETVLFIGLLLLVYLVGLLILYSIILLSRQFIQNPKTAFVLIFIVLLLFVGSLFWILKGFLVNLLISQTNTSILLPTKPILLLSLLCLIPILWFLIFKLLKYRTDL